MASITERSVFVDEFLKGLVSGLTGPENGRVAGIKRKVGEIRRDPASTISTSRRVLDARMALGGDDATYLRMGLSLIWAGDDEVDNERSLFPSSLGAPAVPQATRSALARGIAHDLERRIKVKLDSLAERLGTLVYMLSVPEIGDYVVEEMQEAGMWPKDLKTMPRGTLGALMYLLSKERTPSDRNRAPHSIPITQWIDAIRRGNRIEYIEELISVMAALFGLYVKTDESTLAVSPMNYADLMTSASVDVALARDWSSAEGVFRAQRAHNAGKKITGGEEPDKTNSAAVPKPLLQSAKVVTPGFGISVTEPSPSVTVPIAPASISSNAGVHRDFRQQTNVPPSAPPVRGWLQGLLGSFEPTGSHTLGVQEDGNDRTGKSIPNEHGWRHHRLDLEQEQLVGTPTKNLGRVMELCVTPLCAMMTLSQATSASPLWRPIDEEELDLNKAPVDVTTGAAVGDSTWALTLNTIINSGPHATGLLSTDDEADAYTDAAAVSALYDDRLGPSRATPTEMRVFARELFGTVGTPPPGSSSTDRGRSASFVMNQYTVYAGHLTRFVSYVIQRGLVTDYSPTELAKGIEDAGADVHRHNRLLYWRGASQEIQDDNPLGEPSTPVDADDAAELVVPTAMLRRWTSVRDGVSGSSSRTTEEAMGLRRMISMRGPPIRNSAYDKPPTLRVASPSTAKSEMEVGMSLMLKYEWQRTDHQSVSDTKRDVRWAPIVGSESGTPSVAYHKVAIATCAVSVYEHLIDTAATQDSMTPVSKDYIGCLRAALKLRQLPYMVALDSGYEEEADGAKWGHGLQLAMAKDNKGVSNGSVDVYSTADFPLPINDGGSIFCTYLPSTRVFGDNVVEVVAPAFSGVWPSDIPGGASNTRFGRFGNTVQLVAQFASYTDSSGNPVDTKIFDIERGNLPAREGTKANVWIPYEADDALKGDAARYEFISDAQAVNLALKQMGYDSRPRGPDDEAHVHAPVNGLGIPHIPLGLPFYDFERKSKVDEDRTAFAKDAEGRKTVVGSAKHERVQAGKHIHQPDWLGEWTVKDVSAPHSKVDAFVEECFALSTNIRELILQRDAFNARTSDPPADTEISTKSVVERQRRGAIWQDALREMAISSDRMYSFLRTMSGALHEDVHAVVEVEDNGMEIAQQQVRKRRQDVLQQSTQFQSKLIETVLQSVLKSSKLEIDIASDPAAQGASAAESLVVVNREAVERVRELAQGTSGLPFFTQNVQLEHQLTNNSAPVTVRDLVRQMQGLAEDMRAAMLANVDAFSSDGSRSTLEYLAAPRNAYLVRLKPEASAAITMAYTKFTTEWRLRADQLYRRPSAWEMIEGVDLNLTTAFAEFAAYTLSQSRLHSSNYAAYLGVTPARANALQLGMALQKLVRRAMEYVQLVPAPDYSRGSMAYGAEAPRNFLLNNDPLHGIPAYQSMVTARNFQRGRRWGINLTGNA